MSRKNGASPLKNSLANSAMPEKNISVRQNGRKNARLTKNDKKKLRDILIIIAELAVLGSIYYYILQKQLMWGVQLYYICAGVSGAAAAALRFASEISSDETRVKLKKWLRLSIFIFMPLLLIVLWDTAMMFLGDYIKNFIDFS